jgi:hypothetical protein
MASNLIMDFYGVGVHNGVFTTSKARTKDEKRILWSLLEFSIS